MHQDTTASLDRSHGGIRSSLLRVYVCNRVIANIGRREEKAAEGEGEKGRRGCL